jgi:hypothetical protein
VLGGTVDGKSVGGAAVGDPVGFDVGCVVGCCVRVVNGVGELVGAGDIGARVATVGPDVGELLPEVVGAMVGACEQRAGSSSAVVPRQSTTLLQTDAMGMHSRPVPNPANGPPQLKPDPHAGVGARVVVDCDGAVDGAAVGENVGCGEMGVAVDGSPVGSPVGDEVDGATVVGVPVGTVDGTAVGSIVVGVAVGVTVGCPVG